MLTLISDFSQNILKSAGITIYMMPSIISTAHEYLDFYRDYFSYVQQFKLFKIYFKALISELDRKSVEPITQCFRNSAMVRTLQCFLTRSPWPYGKISSVYQSLPSIFVSEEDGMRAIDGSATSRNWAKKRFVAKVGYYAIRYK
ncbi:MAG: transposase [Deltaproteobacteria bacterium]|jgi:hypothetical protein|nr:transposase [Deltaproteobacteria bacterium]